MRISVCKWIICYLRGVSVLLLFVSPVTSCGQLDTADTQPFTLIAIPDTQYYTMNRPDADWRWAQNAIKEMFLAQTEWIVQNKETHNIKFVLHLGDIVYNTNNSEQWENARECMNVLDGNIPYALCAGNHDGCQRTMVGGPNNTIHYNNYFPWSRYKDLSSTGGNFKSDLAGPMDNTYHYYNGGGVDFMILSIEFGPHDDVIDWVNAVLSEPAHADKKIIILTHGWLNGRTPVAIAGNEDAPQSEKYFRENDPVDLWERAIKKHPNVFLILNGHNGVSNRLVQYGEKGNIIHMAESDFNGLEIDGKFGGGFGFLRIMQFDPTTDEITVTSYSPWRDEFLTDDKNQFVLENIGVF
jgi:calcineurin-like phosphoesterase family protein